MKKDKIVFWVATTILILWEGVMPLGTLLFVPEYATAGTAPLGYPDYFANALIIAKVLGIVGISLPGVPAKLREWAYAGLTFSLIFAFVSHAVVDQIVSYMLLPLLVLGLLAVSYSYGNTIRSGEEGVLEPSGKSAF